MRWHTSIYHCQFTGRRGAGHRRGDAKDRMRPDHGDQALSYYSLSRRFRRRNRPIFSKFIPRQPFLATAHWSSCLVGPGAIGTGTVALPARRITEAMSVLFFLAFLIPDARSIAYPRGVREIITSALLTAWPRRPGDPFLLFIPGKGAWPCHGQVLVPMTSSLEPALYIHD